MSSIWDWSLLAAGNANADDNINWAEGQPPSSVNNSARSMMQRISEMLNDLGAVSSTAGTANIITFTAKSPFSQYKTGIRVMLRASNSNTASASLNVNSVGAKTIFKVAMNGVTALIGGEIIANGIYEFIYNETLADGAGGWFIINPTSLQQVPVGSVIARASPIVPEGFLYCNGQAVSRTTYASLFANIGTRWGTGDGSTTFHIPDFRGFFLRGWDDGRGKDSGRVFASVQESQNLAHTHTVSGTTSTDGAHFHGIKSNANTNSGSNGLRSGDTGQGPLLANVTESAGSHAHSVSGSAASSGGNESRPANYAVYWIIKT